MNMGQMIDDIKLSLEGKGEVEFYGRPEAFWQHLAKCCG